MRYMGWTWQQYEATPASIVDRLIATVQRESQEKKTSEGGPRDRLAIERS